MSQFYYEEEYYEERPRKLMPQEVKEKILERARSLPISINGISHRPHEQTFVFSILEGQPSWLFQSLVRDGVIYSDGDIVARGPKC